MPGPFVGNFNPTGLSGKSSDLHQLPMGVYMVQETHLTNVGISKFKQELAWNQSPYKISHGHPAPPKSPSIRAIGGKPTGVAVLSPYPLRSLCHDWDAHQFATARCQVAATFVDHNWLTVGTVYGFADRASTIETQQQTDALLQGLTSRIVDGAAGFRVVAGDWNVERQFLPQADYWESKGWVDAQKIAQARWQTPCNSTCKRKTIKDFLYLSPELVPYVTDVQVLWSIFPDHAALVVELRPFQTPKAVPVWPKPAAIHWPDDEMPWEGDVQIHNDSDQWYLNITQDFEAYANRLQVQCQRRSLSHSQRGRGNTKEVKSYIGGI